MKRILAVLMVSAIAAAALSLQGSASAGPQGAAAQTGAPNDIVATAVAAGNFTTLASLLERADLVKTLQGKGPYTVFAPTDAAFAKVPKATLDALARNKQKLRSVLLYHVAKGKLRAANIVNRRSVKTLNGQRVGVRVRDGKVYVGGARVVTPDVGTSNGIIHAINTVLIPR
ncbi:MAG: Immunogenic protein precursor [Solirubrobacterales bacterium]|nr:Immunogenic protein precursor [Solirubrobacterales bacterium]